MKYTIHTAYFKKLGNRGIEARLCISNAAVCVSRTGGASGNCVAEELLCLIISTIAHYINDN